MVNKMRNDRLAIVIVGTICLIIAGIISIVVLIMVSVGFAEARSYMDSSYYYSYDSLIEYLGVPRMLNGILSIVGCVANVVVAIGIICKLWNKSFINMPIVWFIGAFGMLCHAIAGIVFIWVTFIPVIFGALCCMGFCICIGIFDLQNKKIENGSSIVLCGLSGCACLFFVVHKIIWMVEYYGGAYGVLGVGLLLMAMGFIAFALFLLVEQKKPKTIERANSVMGDWAQREESLPVNKPAQEYNSHFFTAMVEYKQLLDEGIITEEEYQKKKKQLLNL